MKSLDEIYMLEMIKQKLPGVSDDMLKDAANLIRAELIKRGLIKPKNP